MKIKNYMTRNPITLRPSRSLAEAASLFLDHKIDGAPVVEQGALVGLFTKTHLIRALAMRVDPDKAQVGEFMSRNVKTVSPEDGIWDIDILYTGRYPVVDDGQLIGFITKSDIMVALNQIVGDVTGQLNTVIDSAYNPIIAIDRQGLIRIWNNAAAKLTGVSDEKVLGRFINDVIPSSGLFNVVKTGKPEYGVHLRIGLVNTITNRAPIIKNGEITGAVAVLYDLSELEKVSQELESVKALNAELDAIINNSFDGLYITDGNARTLRINQAVTRMTGIGPDQVLNRTMGELVEDGILSGSGTLLALESRRPETTILTTNTGATLLVSSTPVFDENGDVFRVVTSVRDISELNMLKQQLEQMEGLKDHFEFQMKQMRLRDSGELVFKNAEMERIVFQAMKIAEVDSTVLITGESGVGKEVIAELVQSNSRRKKGPFVKVNCAAIPENLMESELFGYDAGAFTGAKREGKPGLFEVANNGTLVFDEIGDIPMHLQVKMLRAIQEREILRVGGTKPIRVDVRIIAITNRDLEEMVRRDEFREDLFYRLNVVPIHVPPLRDRKEDIPLLVRHFLDKFNRRYDLKKTISAEVVDLLTKHSYPGNIRQLENLIERLVVTSTSGTIGVSELPRGFGKGDEPEIRSGVRPVELNQILPLKAAVENVERMLLERAFSVVDSCHKAADLLKVDASTVSRKANKYGIRIPMNDRGPSV
ncbi:MAG: sigma 54-interacting transcriptional regulator [Solirubrobacterales bacterium]